MSKKIKEGYSRLKVTINGRAFSMYGPKEKVFAEFDAWLVELSAPIKHAIQTAKDNSK